MLIAILFLTVTLSNGNPIINSTEIDHVESSTLLLCDQNTVSNISLAQVLNNNRIWFVLARTKFIYGEQTWNNVLLQTSISTNDTNHFQFIGANSNGSCVHSESGEIRNDSKVNRVSVRWSNEEEGFLEAIFAGENFIHFILCYSIDSNQTDFCALNRSEQFVISENLEKNDTISWLKSHCSAINPNDFIIYDNPEKCLPTVLRGKKNETMTFSTASEEELVTVTQFTPFEFTTRTNRTNRLEVLEEYYNNASANVTHRNGIEETTMMMDIKQMILLVPDNQTNMTVVEEIVPVGNETSEAENPVVSLHKAIVIETTTDILIDPSETTENLSGFLSTAKFPESINSTEMVNITSLVSTNHSISTFSPVTEQVTVDESSSSGTTFFDVPSSKEPSETTTTIDLTTMEATTSTSAVPIDCPALKDCPFDVCTFARKLDPRGCPTCNCLFHSDKANITCPALACPACPYGHYTDPNGCPICRCQTRPYPPMGDRCPQLNCDPCYFGTVKDEYNCDTCICIRPNSQECPMLNCTFGPCKYGSIQDEDNCSSCECLLPTGNDNNTVVCPTLSQCTPCHLGYVKDADGCQTCQCKQRGSVSCPPLPEGCRCEFGSYLNAHGCEACSCLPDPKNASRQACWELVNQGAEVSCAPDGSFSARQCDASRSTCWCVSPSGLRISQFESKPDENANCACATELYQVSSLRMIGHHLLCLPNGNYDPIQCDSRYCSCVDENGKTIGPSISIQNRDQLRCVGVYQQLHPERFLLHKATLEQSDPAHLSHVIASSLCLSHLEQVRHTNITDDHVLIPVCDLNGLYASVQCDQSERYCWCVDKKTGVEMDGTRRLNARPNCNVV